MRCRRCNGDMASEIFIDSFDGTHNHHFYGYRCLLCGNIEDPVISENRKKHLTAGRKPIIEQSVGTPGHNFS